MRTEGGGIQSVGVGKLFDDAQTQTAASGADRAR